LGLTEHLGPSVIDDIYDIIMQRLIQERRPAMASSTGNERRRREIPTDGLCHRNISESGPLLAIDRHPRAPNGPDLNEGLHSSLWDR
jgi:hypothetical protein